MPPPFFLRNPSVLPSLLVRAECALRMMWLQACQYWCSWSVFSSLNVSHSLLKENQPTPALKNSFFWSLLTTTFCSKKKTPYTDPSKWHSLTCKLFSYRSIQNDTLSHCQNLSLIPKRQPRDPKKKLSSSPVFLKKSFRSSPVILQKEKSSSLMLSKTSFYQSL